LALFEREPIAWNTPGAAEARSLYSGVLKLTRTEPALIAGELGEVPTSAPDDVIAYRRGELLVLVNARSHGVSLAVPDFDLAGARDLLTNRAQRGDSVSLPAYGAVVLKGRTRQSP
ncbi:MAG TPA: hypothetical protein VH680_17470, partial [Gemmatimonadales bacterium]